MLARERTRRSLRREQVDRPALAHLFLGGAHAVMDTMGTDLGTVYRDPALAAEAQAVAVGMFGHDAGMFPWGCLTVEAEAFGCSVGWSDRYYPQITSHPLADSTDLSLLADPDPASSGRMPLVLDSLERTREKMGDDVYLIALVVSPFLVAAELRGMVQLLADFVLEPGFVDDLMERVTAGTQRYVRAIAEQGAADAVMFENAGACREMMGPVHAERFLFLHERRLLAAAREASSDVALIEHNCAQTPYVDEVLALDTDAVSVPQADPGQATSRGAAWFGNLDNTRLFLESSPREIEAEARACIMDAPGAGFVLSTACEIPLKAPRANIAALSQALRPG